LSCSTKKYKTKERESSLNFKIIKVEEDGYEDVYNGTVDDNHNYYVYTGLDFGKNGYERMNFINSKNCGEATLSDREACDLGSLVLPNFITGTTNTNWNKLEKTIKLAIRMLDNVLDVNNYPIKLISEKCHNSRRIGLGIMGLADYLFMKQLKYGSKEAVSEIEKLMRFIRDTAYETSIDLAREKGSFPMFDPSAYSKSDFIRSLPAATRMKIKTEGIRNVTCLSLAPTGSSSLLPEVSGGIEPLMFKSYKRKDRVGERIYVHPKYRELLLSGQEIPDWFVDMSDLSPKDHLETQSIITKYVDGSVSKTINCPKGTTKDDLSSLLLEYVRDLKGVTVYVDGSREGQVYESLTEEEALEYLAMESISTVLTMDDVECRCQKKEEESGEEIEFCEMPVKEVVA
jgi:ribonucleoside-diphosphate reductase alpha chain